MSEKKYGLVAYLSNGYYHRSDERYSSEFKFFEEISREELINELVECYNSEIEYDEIRITEDRRFSHFQYEDETYEDFLAREGSVILIRNEAKELVKKHKEEAERKKKEAEEKAKRDRQFDIENRERAELARLKAKYEGK